MKRTITKSYGIRPKATNGLVGYIPGFGSRKKIYKLPKVKKRTLEHIKYMAIACVVYYTALGFIAVLFTKNWYGYLKRQFIVSKECADQNKKKLAGFSYEMLSNTENYQMKLLSECK